MYVKDFAFPNFFSCVHLLGHKRKNYLVFHSSAPAADRRRQELWTRNKQQRCRCAYMSPQWRLSPLTLHTQTLLGRLFVPAAHQPAASSAPIPLAKPISSTENKPPAPSCSHCHPQYPAEHEAQQQLPSCPLYIVSSSFLLTPCCCTPSATPRLFTPPNPTNPCFVLINLIL